MRKDYYRKVKNCFISYKYDISNISIQYISYIYKMRNIRNNKLEKYI